MKPFAYIGCSDDYKKWMDLVLNGEYNIKEVNLGAGAVILDIGANIGSYSYWAKNRFPGCTIFAYEPDPALCDLYVQNMEASDITGIELYSTAVTTFPDAQIKLFTSLTDNIGSHSTDLTLVTGGVKDTLLVNNIQPNELPDCDVIKLDIEGPELAVLTWYLGNRVKNPKIVSYEYHNNATRLGLEKLLASFGYQLCSGFARSPHFGTMNWAKEELFK